MAFENLLERAMINPDQEKTFIDKMLAKKESERARQLFLKNNLTREEIMELLWHLSSNESKLLNYNDWERFVQLKYHIWIQEYIKLLVLTFDYEEELKNKENICTICKKPIETTLKERCRCENPIKIVRLTKRTYTLFDDNKKLIGHNAKFLMGLYLNIGKSSLSINAVGIKEILKQRFELDYGNKPESSYGQKESGLFGLGRKK